MRKIGRNEPCPCGSGKKFKKCHMGREDELALGDAGEVSLEEMGKRITRLPEVTHGRSGEMIGALDIKALTGSSMGITCVDLQEYLDLNLSGGAFADGRGEKRGGIFINLLKTRDSDPDHIYLAISRDIEDSALVHELAHALDFLGGSKLMPGSQTALGYEFGIPVEHLEHPMEFGKWLSFLQERFDIQLDADDAIIAYLYRNGLLISGKDIASKNTFLLKAKSDKILMFLSENSKDVDALIRNRPGYIGPREVGD